ncbi:MAG: MMPL family transporter [Bacteroidia bacterium]|nr:MMPL family transporter [Bacteroidia bacterium]
MLLACFTAVAAFFASKAELGYNMQKLVPADDPDYKVYVDFKKTFGEDGNKLAIGFQSKELFKLGMFNDYLKLCNDLATVNGVTEVISPARLYNLSIDSNEKFQTSLLIKNPLKSQEELDSVQDIFQSLRFYHGLLYNDTSNVALAVVGLNDSVLNTNERNILIPRIQEMCEAFGTKHKVDMHYSGLPFIRTEYATNVRREIILFTIIAFFVTGLLILAFFRSISTLLISLLFIVIGVLTMLAVTALLGFKITILTGILPPVLVVVGVQNSIYLINKYHEEYRRHGNKARALQRIIARTGVATFLINFTTAIGFGTFYFTKTAILEQFGIVAFITINIIFFVNIIGIPVLYSFLPTPSDKQTQHLENKNVANFLSWVKFNAFNRKRRIYFWSVAVTLLGAVYIVKLKPLSYMVDDIPHTSKVYRDLEFFQRNFRGVMPFEVLVTTNEPGYASEPEAIVKVNSFQKAMRRFPELSKPMSVAEVVSFANQTVNEGDPAQYRVPSVLDMATIQGYFPDKKPGSKRSVVEGMIDSTKSKMRISYQMKDIGSVAMDTLVDDVKQIADNIFPKDKYKVNITGTSAIFLKGNTYLYGSLVQSTLWALLIISLTMGLLFPSIKMIIISVIPNILPLLVTGGLMGYFHVPLKPSTILVFSIAFGITVDATIHFMTSFRRHLFHNNVSLREALSETIMEVGLSMIYTVVALFAGFMIFVFSRFEGTQSLGWLTAVTLFTGLVANLFLLPALLLTFEKSLNPREELKEQVIELPDED